MIGRGGRYTESFWQPYFLPNARSQTKNEAKISNFENVGRFWCSVHCLWGLAAFLLLHNTVQVGFLSPAATSIDQSQMKKSLNVQRFHLLYFVFEIFKLPYKNSFMCKNKLFKLYNNYKRSFDHQFIPLTDSGMVCNLLA